MGERDEPRPWSEQLLVLVQDHLSVIVNRRDAEACALLGRKQLPRDDVRVVLEPGDDNLVVFADVPAAPALRHQVDAFRRASHEHDLLGRRCVQEAADLLARGLVRVGRARGEGVSRAVDVRVLVLVEVGDPIDHALRLLRRRGVVEPHEPSAVHDFVQDGEVASDRRDVEQPRARDSNSGRGPDGTRGPGVPSAASMRMARRERSRGSHPIRPSRGAHAASKEARLPVRASSACAIGQCACVRPLIEKVKL